MELLLDPGPRQTWGTGDALEARAIAAKLWNRSIAAAAFCRAYLFIQRPGNLVVHHLFSRVWAPAFCRAPGRGQRKGVP